MIKFIKLTTLSSITALLVACGGFGDDEFSSDIDDVNFSSGDLNLSKYVAIGDSLTAGFADSALYIDGQTNSFPNILAQSFAKAGGSSTFTQPLMNDNLGGLISSMPAITAGLEAAGVNESRLVLTIDADGDLGPARQAELTPSAVSTTSLDAFPLVGSDFNNMGVPGAKSFHLTLTTYGDITALATTANPYFVRFAKNTSTSVIADALAQAPTFFTLWIGNNDILGYATAGGTGQDSTGGYGVASGDITDPAVFSATYSGILTALSPSATRQGVLINIPKITSIPYFTAVPYNPLPLTQAQVDDANTGYAAYNAGLDSAVSVIGNAAVFSQEEADRRKISFTVGQNAPVILDESLTNLGAINGAFAALLQFRQAKEGEDFILLPTSSDLGESREAADASNAAFIGQVVGVSAPLEDAEVLTATEAAEVESARVAFNTTINNAADADDNLILLDAASALEEVASSDGLNFGGGSVTSVFATGGAFSLDGVHPTAKGYAVIANLVAEALDSNFNSTLPRVNPNDYPEVYLQFPDGYDFSQ